MKTYESPAHSALQVYFDHLAHVIRTHVSEIQYAAICEQHEALQRDFLNGTLRPLPQRRNPRPRNRA